MYNSAVVDMNTVNPYLEGVVGHLDGIYASDGQYDLYANIRKLGTDVDNMHMALQSLQVDLDVVLQYFNQTRALHTSEQIAELDLQYKEQYLLFGQRKSATIRDLQRVISEYDIIQEEVIRQLKLWQRNQALAGNGAPFNDNLDQKQVCVEMLVDMVAKIHSFVNLLTSMNMGDSDDALLYDLLDHVLSVQRMLVLSAFIVERQPPQVIKTQAKFGASVRWLIGPQLGVYTNKTSIKSFLLSEAQAQLFTANNRNSDMETCTPPKACGNIGNNNSIMTYEPSSRVLSAIFRDMQLTNIKRAEKKGAECVMDEKLYILFCTTVSFNGFKMSCWTLSLPIVVIVHVNQEPQSWATIIWDNAFPDIMREPFQVPKAMCWQQLSAVLNTKFYSATGRGLTRDYLQLLYEKLCGNEGGKESVFITWEQFCKELLPGLTFTFWEWFFAIMKLTKDHLSDLWKEGLIIGFIDKRKTLEEILPMQPYGTFLLRFSDSELGGITIAFVDDQGNKLMLTPWTARDLQIRCLADRIHDVNVLRFLYPKNLARDVAFAAFYNHQVENQKSTRDGYVESGIKVNVPAIEGGSVAGTPPQQPPSTDIIDESFAFDFTFPDWCIP